MKLKITLPQRRQYTKLFYEWKPGFRDWDRMEKAIVEATDNVTDPKDLQAIWMSRARLEAHKYGRVDLIFDYGKEEKYWVAVLNTYADDEPCGTDGWYDCDQDYKAALDADEGFPEAWALWKRKP